MNIDDLIEDPALHPFSISPEGVTFVRVTRDSMVDATFINEFNLKHCEERRVVKLSELAGISIEAGNCNFIFHTAFCCSTLLARAMELPGKCHSLKEPNLLNDLAKAKRASSNSPQFQAVVPLSVKLLARPSWGRENTVIKPSNGANNLLLEIAEILPQARFLLLYSSLEEFVGSIVRKGLEGRLFARTLYLTIQEEARLKMNLRPEEQFMLSDLQVAALCWLFQVSVFQSVVGVLSPDRVRTLDSLEFLDRKAETVHSTSSFFGLGFTHDEANEIANGPVFTRDSKRQDKVFADDGRAYNAAATQEQYRDELEKVVVWANQVADLNKIQIPDGLGLLERGGE